MERIVQCEKCTTVIVADLGLKNEYFGPTIHCGYCNSILLMSSFIFTPHIVPTRPVRTLYWTGSLTSFPPFIVEPLIIEDSITWTMPPLPNLNKGKL